MKVWSSAGEVLKKSPADGFSHEPQIPPVRVLGTGRW